MSLCQCMRDGEKMWRWLSVHSLGQLHQGPNDSFYGYHPTLFESFCIYLIFIIIISELLLLSHPSYKHGPEHRDSIFSLRTTQLLSGRVGLGPHLQSPLLLNTEVNWEKEEPRPQSEGHKLFGPLLLTAKMALAQGTVPS